MTPFRFPTGDRCRAPSSGAHARKNPACTRVAPLLSLALSGSLAHAAAHPAPDLPAPPTEPAATGELADLSLEQLMEIEVPSVFAASRTSQKVTRAPSSISIVTADDIRHFGYRNLAEALNNVAGTYLGNDRQYRYLGIRGSLRPSDYLGRVLLLVDGHRVNENVFGGFNIGQDAVIDVDLVERIEVVRGPSSSIYGSSAFLGVLNVVTRRPADSRHLEVSAEAGSMDTYSGRLTLAHRFDEDIDWLLSGSLFHSRGDRDLYFPEFDAPATHDGIARNSDEERAGRLFSSLTFHDLTLSGAFVRREKNIPTASFETLFNQGDERSLDGRAYVDLRYASEVTDNGHLLARVAYDHLRYEGWYPYEPEPPGTSVLINRDVALGDWISVESQWTQTFHDRHTAIFGAEYHENLRQFQRNFNEGDPVDLLRVDEETRNIGVYGQAEVTVVDPLRLNAGLRYDLYSDIGETLNPRAAILYSPVESTTLKALFGTAYRAPNQYELHYESPFDYRAPQSLDPETITTYELVWEQYFGARHVASLSGYYYELDDLISPVEDPADGRKVYSNIDQVQALGLELQWSTRWDSGLRTSLSYGLQRSRDARDGLELSFSPRHLAKLHLLAPIWRDRLRAGLEVLYQSEVLNENQRRIGDFGLVNLTLSSRNLLPGLDVSASVYNLLDIDYSHPASVDHALEAIPQDGVTFRLKATYRF